MILWGSGEVDEDCARGWFRWCQKMAVLNFGERYIYGDVGHRSALWSRSVPSVYDTIRTNQTSPWQQWYLNLHVAEVTGTSSRPGHGRYSWWAVSMRVISESECPAHGWGGASGCGWHPSKFQSWGKASHQNFYLSQGTLVFNEVRWCYPHTQKSIPILIFLCYPVKLDLRNEMI